MDNGEDEIAKKLRLSGIATSASWLFDQPELGIRNGTRFIVQSSEIVYELIDSRTVLIVLYRRTKQDRRSLACSFSPLIWFVSFLIDHMPGVNVVKGLVDVFPYRSEQGISSLRLAKFYQLCGAEEVEVDGIRWIKLETANFVPFKKIEYCVFSHMQF